MSCVLAGGALCPPVTICHPHPRAHPASPGAACSLPALRAARGSSCLFPLQLLFCSAPASLFHLPMLFHTFLHLFHTFLHLSMLFHSLPFSLSFSLVCPPTFLLLFLLPCLFTPSLWSQLCPAFLSTSHSHSHFLYVPTAKSSGVRKKQIPVLGGFGYSQGPSRLPSLLSAQPSPCLPLLPAGPLHCLPRGPLVLWGAPRPCQLHSVVSLLFCLQAESISAPHHVADWLLLSSEEAAGVHRAASLRACTESIIASMHRAALLQVRTEQCCCKLCSALPGQRWEVSEQKPAGSCLSAGFAPAPGDEAAGCLSRRCHCRPQALSTHRRKGRRSSTGSVL